MRKKPKADEAIAIRLYVDEMERVKEVFEKRFQKRYPFALMEHFVRVWLALPVQDAKAVLTEEERYYLSGAINNLPAEGDHGPFVTTVAVATKDYVEIDDIPKRKSRRKTP